MVATFFNIIMGLFQVASIIELFFVLGQIKKAALEKESEAKPPSLLAIAVTYLVATGFAAVCFISLLYLTATFSLDRVDLVHEITAKFFIALLAMLTAVVLLVSIRLCKLRKMDVPINDGRTALIKYYLVFTIGYLTRVVDDIIQVHLDEQTLLKESLFDFCSLISDAIPILCLLLFHY